METPKVHIFWDNSNIYISGQTVGMDKERLSAHMTFRIHFENLFKLAQMGRPVAKALAVGSIPPELQSVWDYMRTLGVDVELQERGRQTGAEQGVDKSLQVAMLRALADNPAPQVAVLLTGDGAGYLDGVGFHADLERMARSGWGIEVLAWEKTCNQRLKDWAKKDGIFIRLEDYYDSITFLADKRNVRHLNLTHRGSAQPRLGQTAPASPTATSAVKFAMPVIVPPVKLTPEQEREMQRQMRRERGARRQAKRLAARKKK